MIVEQIKFTPAEVQGLKCAVPISVARVEVSCWGCPKSWMGVTADTQEEVYVRYRWGFLRISVGDETVFGCQVDIETDEEAKAKYELMREAAKSGKGLTLEQIDGMEESDRVMKKFMAEHQGCGDHSYSGEISYEDLKRITKDWFVWPDQESEREDVRES